MKTVFDQKTKAELTDRISRLNGQSVAQWGKMNVYQMILHCAMWEEMALGKKQYKQVFIGRLFGKMALNSLLKDERPLKQNTPTIPEFKIPGNGDVEAAKATWSALIEEYARLSNPGIIHPFFGKMTKDQIGYLAYKHIDHHLRQFNC